jgi:hypothetical protein
VKIATSRHNQRHSTVFVANDILYMVSGGHLCMIDGKTHVSITRRGAQRACSCLPNYHSLTAAKSTHYNSDGTVSVIYVHDRNVMRMIMIPGGQWAQQNIWSAPIISDGIAYDANLDRLVVFCDKTLRSDKVISLQWHHALDYIYRIESILCIHGDNAIFTTRGGIALATLGKDRYVVKWAKDLECRTIAAAYISDCVLVIIGFKDYQAVQNFYNLADGTEYSIILTV